MYNAELTELINSYSYIAGVAYHKTYLTTTGAYDVLYHTITLLACVTNHHGLHGLRWQAL